MVRWYGLFLSYTELLQWFHDPRPYRKAPLFYTADTLVEVEEIRVIYDVGQIENAAVDK